MNIEGLLSVSVIDGALAIARHRHQYPDVSVTDCIRQLRNGSSDLSGYDFDSALKLADLVGWDAFELYDDRVSQLRTTIFRIAVIAKPLWARLSVHGRKHVSGMVSDDHRQILDYANLFESSPSEATIEWWDRLARQFWSEQSDDKFISGRAGESLTMQYEIQRLQKLNLRECTPTWVAVESNSFGYDVLSYDLNQTRHIVQIQIESKAFNQVAEKFFITRHEWDVAARNRSTYRFYIWNLTTTELTILRVEQLVGHIPQEIGNGRWTTVELSLKHLV